MNFNSDVFRKMTRTLLSLVRDGLRFHPWKTMLDNIRGSGTNGCHCCRDFLPKYLQYIAKSAPRVKACSLRHRPGNPHKPLQRDIDEAVSATTPLAGHMELDNVLPRPSAVRPSRCRLSPSTLAPAADAHCHQALHHHHDTKTRGRPAAAIPVSRIALPAHLAGLLDASLYFCSLKRPNKIHCLHGVLS